ncbi:class I SAM-dependent methyltransferase [Teredinibacter waterburyi]|jgi:Ribosomal protein L11 methylase|uniref:class I SAM-dependent methyltransferase n=1 Tax=Teredinibacter waterburyi TaxID=1500538 RepID=UPI00165FED6E|nr:class I SAM-dependent methyltransferase [Teredinibacter waterburyi]
MDINFKFGRNWQQFLDESFDHKRVTIAQQHLLKTLRLENLKGKIFLDIGCGSGIHSLAALAAGAEKVISIDVDPQSVAATKSLWRNAGKPRNWSQAEGSVLDEAFMQSLPKADIVYSWGVLHHTGSMWEALDKVTIPLATDGILYIALYAYEMYQNPTPEYWIETKRAYNQASPEQREKMEYDYAWEQVLKPVAAKGENPLLVIKDYSKSRGMEFWTDVRDWLGGYPMEFAKASDIAQHFYRQHNMIVVDIVTGEGNTEFLLRSVDSPSAGQHITDEYDIINISVATQPIDGFGYKVHLPEYSAFADTDGEHFKSPLLVYENGLLLGFPHARFESINTLGEGRFCHWKDSLLYSSSDNSDPRINGKTYSLRVPKKLDK